MLHPCDIIFRNHAHVIFEFDTKPFQVWIKVFGLEIELFGKLVNSHNIL